MWFKESDKAYFCHTICQEWSKEGSKKFPKMLWYKRNKDFENKVESFTKNGKNREYSRTARIDKKGKICDIVEKLLQKSESYIRHRSHADYISEVFPLIRGAFIGKYIELDFSENLTLKPKFEVLDGLFSRKQYSLHCTIVEPGENKYVYHISEHANHDPVFVHEVTFFNGGTSKIRL